ncbi:hypothetical protein R3W88_022818 [Solanum pinnatisectum]|uniref:Uncharacterized protein n=1 Tax=Solanum pinnatisectum TaxID=50273 RepID=A0AAV9LZ45_9SOLN|nr:hypothetical protein R3W88_022818 [Solanum pinnatisectum]
MRHLTIEVKQANMKKMVGDISIQRLIKFLSQMSLLHNLGQIWLKLKPYNLVDIPMYDGIGIPQMHLTTYLDWLASIGQGNEFHMRLFVRMLTWPTLMWYANQDTWKCSLGASKGCGLLKRKSIESHEEMKGHESQKKVPKSTLGHYCLNEAQSRDKGKIIKKTQNFTTLSEPISFVFKKLRSLGILQPKPREILLHPFIPTKQCTFHSGMLEPTS